MKYLRVYYWGASFASLFLWIIICGIALLNNGLVSITLDFNKYGENFFEFILVILGFILLITIGLRDIRKISLEESKMKTLNMETSKNTHLYLKTLTCRFCDTNFDISEDEETVKHENILYKIYPICPNCCLSITQKLTKTSNIDELINLKHIAKLEEGIKTL